MSSSDINKPLASCFLEMLFDEQYNSGKAKKHLDALAYIFNHDVFFKEDFRLATKRNVYFTLYCPLEGDSVDMIKGNIRKFVLEYMNTINKRITPAQMEEAIKPLFMAFEICTPYQNLYPDYAVICKAYKKYRSIKKFEIASGWMRRRYVFNQLLEDNLHGKSTYAQIAIAFSDEEVDLQHFVRMLSREDTIMYIIATNRKDDDYSFASILLTAKTLYEKRLKRDDFRPYCTVNHLRDAASNSVNQAIKDLLSDKRVKEYEMKLLTFVWEALGDHSFAAAHYDDLIDRRRLDRVTILKNYLKHRALLHYSYLKQKEFEDKQVEYKISMSKDYLPAAFPRIDQVNESVSQLEDRTAAKIIGTSNKETKNKTSTMREKTFTPSITMQSSETGLDNASAQAVKQAMRDVARKMYEGGMGFDDIAKITGLNKAEVRKAIQ